MILRCLPGILLFLSVCVQAQALSDAEGLELLEAVYTRHHHYPFVYETQSMVLIDDRGNRETRKLNLYSRANESGDQYFMLLFVSPVDVAGVALLATRSEDEKTNERMYLPAFGDFLIANALEGTEVSGLETSSFLGTDFSIESLVGEVLADYQYFRRTDQVHEDIPYYVVDVFPKLSDEKRLRGFPIRRHFIRQDNLYITRTDFFDDLGKLIKQKTSHDLTQVLGEMWRANMVLMENFEDRHKSLVKVDSRVFSEDYVPEKIFTLAWLVENASTLKHDNQAQSSDESLVAEPPS